MIVTQPVLRRDGTILTAPGYDPASGIYLHWPGDPLILPVKPTRSDAARAAETLLALVADFPFEADYHLAAWLAALLTPLCRPAFDGPSPLFLAVANVRAAGKGKLLGVAARILSGEGFPNLTYPKDHRGRPDEAELEKRLTTHFRTGAQTGMFDDLTGDFGDAVLNNLMSVSSATPSAGRAASDWSRPWRSRKSEKNSGSWVTSLPTQRSTGGFASSRL